MRTLICFSFLSLLAVDCQAITIPTVPVGNAGNAPDLATGYGAVAYDYRMGTYEVTIGQYTAFLNAVAATDTYGLYYPRLATDLNVAGISQSGVSGSYSYSVIGSANHPVTYVSWGDAARFTNWLHNGQPTGLQNAGTTEDGAYTLNGAMTDAQLVAVSRNAGAQWFIPSENEWYKAAYYQPASQGGDVDNYWAYPTRTNNVPYSAQPNGGSATTPSNTANIYKNDGIANGYDNGYAATGSTSPSNTQNYLTNIGSYRTAIGPYGTFDQGGNAWEWNEAVLYTLFRGVRGSSWERDYTSMDAMHRDYGIPSVNVDFFGFRVATVPEPSTFALAALGIISVLACEWRRRKR